MATNAFSPGATTNKRQTFSTIQSTVVRFKNMSTLSTLPLMESQIFCNYTIFLEDLEFEFDKLFVLNHFWRKFLPRSRINIPEFPDNRPLSFHEASLCEELRERRENVGHKLMLRMNWTGDTYFIL